MKQEWIASVVLLAEAIPPQQIDHYLKQIINEQTYKNLDLLILTVPRPDLEELQNQWNETEHSVRWLEASPGVDLVAMGNESTVGEVVFYKTCGATVWYPHHIEVHIKDFQ